MKTWGGGGGGNGESYQMLFGGDHFSQEPILVK